MNSCRNLTEKERDVFFEHFHIVCIELSKEDDASASEPWGAPWTWGSEILLRGDTVEQMAYNFYQDMKEEIQQNIEYYTESGELKDDIC
jgi:hypothetical protein